MIEVGNIVSFNDSATHLAAVWCRQHEINGKVIRITSGMLELDVGLYYKVYASPTQVNFVAPVGEIQQVPRELEVTAPVPDDGC